MTTTHMSGAARALQREIAQYCEESEGPLRFMEVCGTHTMAVAESGLRSLFPENLHLVSGPGCPVCVTETQYIDHAVALGREHNAVLVTFGDLVRVPGSNGSLADFRSEGGSVRVVYSPMDALVAASENPGRPTVFLGVGFETTIPTVAATVKAAHTAGIHNFYVLCAFKTIHEPLKILADKSDLHGFLLPGHVSAIVGTKCYEYLVTDFGKPGAVAGFEAADILLALRELVRMASEQSPEIVNSYARVVRPDGNPAARAIINEVLEPADASWRGLGVISGSGLKLTGEYARFDAATHLPVDVPPAKDDPRCLCAAILTGSKTPNKCGLFGRECTPESPVGPCMVSSEGTCAAYFKYGI